MANIEVRPATREDIFAFMGECRQTMKAFVAIHEGKPIALGGLAFIKGRVVAFCDLGDDQAKRHPKTLHKAALGVMKAALDSRHRYIFAERSETEPTAARWLERLGFRPVDQAGKVMLWQS